MKSTPKKKQIKRTLITPPGGKRKKEDGLYPMTVSYQKLLKRDGTGRTMRLIMSIYGLHGAILFIIRNILQKNLKLKEESLILRLLAKGLLKLRQNRKK